MSNRHVAAHPGCYGLPHSLLEGNAKSAVTPIAALGSQLLGSEATLGGYSLAIQAHEMLDAQVVDIGIVGDALPRERKSRGRSVLGC